MNPTLERSAEFIPPDDSRGLAVGIIPRAFHGFRRKRGEWVALGSVMAAGRNEFRAPSRLGSARWIRWLLAVGFTSQLAAQVPQWIWSDTNAPSATGTTNYFRKGFQTPPLLWNARLTVVADDSAEVFLNGLPVAVSSGPQDVVRAEVSVRLNQGENVIAVRARNASGPAGLLVNLNLNGGTNVVTDATWLVSTNPEPDWNTLRFNAAHWRAAGVIGPDGIAPWGAALTQASATPAESLKLPPGFRAELLRSARADEGSWICLAFDEQGRAVVSPQGRDVPLLRLTLAGAGVSRVERIGAPIRSAMGLLFAFGSLYANGIGPEGTGLHRLTDANHNDQFEPEEMRLLKRFEGGSEHGPHALAAGPDGHLYVLNGNGTRLPRGLAASSPLSHYGEDCLSLNPDEGPRSDTPAPAGHILRTDPDGREWQLWMGGLRNAYDFDFNADGELFAFDSDMEWDWGTPWYRPARIVHCVSGADFGWRDGTRLWPDDYADTLPGVADVGIGSPTGVKFGTRSHFPGRYRRALFALDWSYGRIVVVHLEASGANYRGKVEPFLSGAPLNLTDVEFGPDGALYFITGGRGTQSGLYRVSHAGAAGQSPGPLTPVSPPDPARALRHQLEQYHGVRHPAAVTIAWPHLASPDRSIRYAARVALESQEVAEWRDRALAETDSVAGPLALLALARVGGGDTETQDRLLRHWAGLPSPGSHERDALPLLRALELCYLRQGRPEPDHARRAIVALDAGFPAATWAENRELTRLLVYLGSPGVTAKAVGLLVQALTREEQFHYIAQLRNVRGGWTLADRERYFGWWLNPRGSTGHLNNLPLWFADVGRTDVDGAWIDKYLGEFRSDALATLSLEERTALGPLLAQPYRRARLIPTPLRTHVRDWSLAELLPRLDRVNGGRDFARGRRAFAEAQCLSCHRMGNDGGFLGPELTAAGSRYDARSLLESILEPSKVINEQYRDTIVELADGESVSGRLLAQDDSRLVLQSDPLAGTRQEIPRARVKALLPAALSSMPAGLVNTFTEDEILDLIAYVQAGGNPQAAAFTSPP